MPATEDLIQVGFSLHQEGKLEEAENAYKEALAQDSDNAEIYNLLGVLKLQQKAGGKNKGKIIAQVAEHIAQLILNAKGRDGFFGHTVHLLCYALQTRPGNSCFFTKNVNQGAIML